MVTQHQNNPVSMASVSYSFCMAMLHSLWQAAALLLLYTGFNSLLPGKQSPLTKRNLLFLLVTAQLVLFAGTWLFYFADTSETAASIAFNSMAERLLPENTLKQVTPWLFGAYLLILAQRTGQSVYTWMRFKKQYRQGLQKPGIDLKLFTAQKALLFGIKRKVQLWFSETIHTPVTFGFFKPVILLPVALVNRISTEQAETLIVHELTHIRSNDYLLNWYLVIMENIFFFNPFVHALAGKIRLEREKYCDISVMAFEYPALLYAQTLLEAERLKQAVPAFHLAAVERKKQLLQRIQFFTGNLRFGKDKRRHVIPPVASLLLFCVLAAGILFRSGNSKSVMVQTAAVATDAKPAGSEYRFTTDGAEWTNNIESIITDENLEAISKEVARQQPVIEARLKEMEPFLKSVQEKAEEISKNVIRQVGITSSYIQPVAFQETDNNSRQIIIREEQSGTKAASVKVYRATFQNGEWKIVPEWMVSAKERATDTSLQPDSVNVPVYPSDQQ